MEVFEQGRKYIKTNAGSTNLPGARGRMATVVNGSIVPPERCRASCPLFASK